MAKLYLRTFGCQMNEYDSEKIADVLREAEGLEPAARPEDADLIVFNTCWCAKRRRKSCSPTSAGSST